MMAKEYQMLLNFYSMHEATIRKNEGFVRRRVAAGSSTSMSTGFIRRDIATKRAFMIWVENTTQKRIPMDGYIITNKTLLLKLRISCRLPLQLKRSCRFLQAMVGLKDLNNDIYLHNLRLKGE
ncbi:hypothetical protein CDAR_294361 [Caerostris darwini]|uniref:Uncharacterized protein n=1 Tax=Caerostris darwini TaxID=1538125 RepID=A0AAV4UKH3_9ARAC|nr:hypothetical protein CDAR_294361 [Caerostris darwini]